MKAFRTEIRRSISRSKGRFFAILLIVALGAGFYAGLRSTAPDMRRTVDQYMKDGNLMDLQLLSTMGFSDSDVQAVSQVEGVEAAMPTYYTDAVTTVDQKDITIRIHALPPLGAEDTSTESMNRPTLVEGRWPQNSGECVVEKGKDIKNSIELGSTITMQSCTGGLSDTLKTDAFTVVGYVDSSYYVSFSVGTTTIGNGQLDRYAFILPEDFKSSAYSTLYLKVKNADSVSTFSDRYDEIVGAVSDRLEDIRESRQDDRLQEVKADAEQTLSDAQKKYDDAKADTDSQLNEAQQKLLDGAAQIAENERTLEDAEAKLAAGKQEYESGLAAYQEKAAETIPQLNAAQDQIDAGKETLAEKKQQLEDAEKKLEEGKEQLTSAEQLVQSIPQLEAGIKQAQQTINDLTAKQGPLEAQVAGLKTQAETLNAQIAALDPKAPDYENQKAELKNQLDQVNAELSQAESGLQQVNDGITAANSELQNLGGLLAQANALSPQLDSMREQLTSAQQQIGEGQEAITSGEEEIAANQQKVDSGREQLSAAKEKLDSAQKEISANETRLAQGRQQLEEAKNTLSDGQKSYDDAKKEAEEKLLNAKQELDDGKAKLDDLKAPTWYILDRHKNLGFASFESDADRMDSISTVFPVLFFLVAALVALTTMTRMVEEERVLIGTYFSLGYSKHTILKKYLFYAAVAGVAGCAIGIPLGMYILPPICWNSYRLIYIAPPAILEFNLKYTAIGFFASLGTSLGATAFAVVSSLKESPASLMLPKAPSPGKRILLERIHPIWRRMKFTSKVTARNMFRYKRRLIMTIVGIAGATGLLLTGYGIKDSISDIITNQYNVLYSYNVVAHLKDGNVSEEAKKVLEDPQKTSGWMKDERRNIDIDNESGKSISGYLFVPETADELPNFVNLRLRKSHEQVPFGSNSVVLTEKAAGQLGVSVGGKVIIKNNEGKEVSFTVTGITENYLYHFLYIDPVLYESVTGDQPQYNELCIEANAPDSDTQKAYSDELLSSDGISIVTFLRDTTKAFERMIESLNNIILVLIFCAGMLAFIVLYNLTNINITERQRELATIKVLGFYDREVSAYIYRETSWLTILGCGAGLLLGILMHAYVITTVEIDVVMFGREIAPQSFLYSALLTLLFSVIVDLFMNRKLKRINMVESLKSVD